ncbi:competence type IV pilus minor pilin ComGF [Atopobacter sp. AH10]|uniref:competence type IV pilus minor pilin ComGF n=1 Tax=Atopobacter sp. AH10 TaxID=2315861 RepID=UPI00351A626C
MPSVLESQSRDPLFDQHWLVNRIQYEMTNYKLEELSPVDIYLTPRNGLGKSYLYEKYSGKDGLMIRRRSTRGGHVVLLNNIDRLRFSYIQKGEKPIVQLELDKGKKKNRYWLFPTY